MSTEEQNELLVFGYVRDKCSKKMLPMELVQIILDYATIIFQFIKRDGCKWTITNDGLTATSPLISFVVCLFGQRLHHQTKAKMEVTFRLDKGDSNDIGIGLVTPSFDNFTRHCRDKVESCFMYGNGYFVYDNQYFKCKHGNKTHRFENAYFGSRGSSHSVTLSVDMEAKIARLKGYEIQIVEDVVQIAIISGRQHTVTVVE